MNLEQVKSLKRDPEFRWRDQYGEPHRLADMETRHVFMSLRMIWNHTAPVDWRIEPYRRYNLRRSEAYLKDAVRELCIELSHRRDLTPYYLRCLWHMAEKLEKHGTLRLTHEEGETQ